MDHNTQYQNHKTTLEMLEEAFPVGSPFPPLLAFTDETLRGKDWEGVPFYVLTSGSEVPMVKGQIVSRYSNVKEYQVGIYLRFHHSPPILVVPSEEGTILEYRQL